MGFIGYFNNHFRLKFLRGLTERKLEGVLNMPAQIILFSFLLLISSASFARGPAVEDFVGIEMVEETSPNLHGAELLYNLEQDVNLIARAENSPGQTAPGVQSKPWTTSAIFALITLLGLPLLSWSLAMNYFRKKAQTESAANIEILENYRKQKAELQDEEEQQRNVS